MCQKPDELPRPEVHQPVRGDTEGSGNLSRELSSCPSCGASAFPEPCPECKSKMHDFVDGCPTCGDRYWYDCPVCGFEGTKVQADAILSSPCGYNGVQQEEIDLHESLCPKCQKIKMNNDIFGEGG